MDYSYVSCITKGLSYHTPLKITFPSCPKRKEHFKFCEMWRSDPKFNEIKELHDNRWDETLLAQQKERRIKYLEILKSSLSLIKQQCKQQWLNYGDQGSRFFITKMKQKKLYNYVYAIKDKRGNRREGFAEVTRVMAQEGHSATILSIPFIKSPGPDGFSSSFFKASWNKVEKITKNITIWATKNTSYARRVALSNSILMGIYTFWAMIFILHKGVIKEGNKMCKNFMWGADEVYRKIPHVSWEETCKPKKYGGLGLINMEAWNHASIAKLVWAITKKRTCCGLNGCMSDT
ncbi:hypothetical protein Cgig2_008598 [Carnegiea gigantea]|uniref:Uncharacterized protein n=1 Tax=Carnegiea gigantea TaxID=171969 RepID=A0A9Q1JUU9_9CARY|nr:hypothetical protein Cgig2_008598 [Carnegiea gigantea]